MLLPDQSRHWDRSDTDDLAKGVALALVGALAVELAKWGVDELRRKLSPDGSQAEGIEGGDS